MGSLDYSELWAGRHEFSGTQKIEILSPPSWFMPYILSSEIPYSDSGFLLIKRRGTALTLNVLTQESGALGFKLWASVSLLPTFPTKIVRMSD